MPDRLCFLVCDNLEREVSAIVESEQFDGVVVHTFEAHCDCPQVEWNALRGAIRACSKDCSQIHVLGGACLASLRVLPDEMEYCRLHKLSSCFNLFVGNDAVAGHLQSGAYLLTPGWLKRWQSCLGEWGFDQETAHKFFAESATRLVLLDTGVDKISAERLAEFASFIGLPFEIVPIGLDFARLFLTRIVLEWQLENERSRSAEALTSTSRRLADHAMVIDLIGHLPRAMTEAQAIDKILDLFAMLCAPTSLIYVPFVGSQPGEAQARPDSLPVTEAKTRLAAFDRDYGWTDSANGFLLRISHQDETLGVLEVEGLAFPEYKQHYLNLALTVVQVCGLAFANARSYQKQQSLIEQLEQVLAQREYTEQGLEKRNRELSLLNRVGQELTSMLDLHQVLDRLLHAINEAIGVEGSSVWLWDAAQPEQLICRASTRPGSRRSPVGLGLKAGQGVIGWVAQHGDCALVPIVEEDPRFTREIDDLIGFRTRSLLIVPLWLQDKIIGTLEAVNKYVGKFNDDDCNLLETLAATAAVAIENARLVNTLRQRTEELQTRNEELDAFAHTVAHDLKAPLGIIVGYAELYAHEDQSTGDDLRRALDAVDRTAHKMNTIIEELLLFAEVRSAEVVLEPLNMADILAQIRERFELDIQQRQAQVIWPDVSAWPVALGYAPWIEEVWANYVSNALKYGSAPGEPPRIEIGATLPPNGAHDGAVCFWVRDSGPGLSPEDQAQLFRPFERLGKTRGKAHGLGLSIVRRIVEKLGGKVGLESQAGQGSMFSFTLKQAPV